MHGEGYTVPKRPHALRVVDPKAPNATKASEFDEENPRST